MRRALGVTAAIVLIWAIQDIAIWQRIFESHHLERYDSVYQPWHQALLFALIILGVAWVRGGWGVWSGIAAYWLSYGGWADVLYYWLDGRPIPHSLPWLNDYHPLILGARPVTSADLVTSAVIWGMAVVVLSVVGAAFPKLKTLTSRVRRVGVRSRSCSELSLGR